MDNNSREGSFSYTYSAEQQAELRRIRDKYSTGPADEAEDKLERLRRLDAGAARRGSAASIAVGVAGTLALGVGMCCCLVWGMFAVGIPVGAAGIAAVAAAYPVYVRVTRREREKIAPEVLHLTDELLK